MGMVERPIDKREKTILYRSQRLIDVVPLTGSLRASQLASSSFKFQIPSRKHLLVRHVFLSLPLFGTLVHPASTTHTEGEEICCSG